MESGLRDFSFLPAHVGIEKSYIYVYVCICVCVYIYIYILVFYCYCFMKGSGSCSGNGNIDFLLDNILLIGRLCILLRVLEEKV